MAIISCSGLSKDMLHECEDSDSWEKVCGLVAFWINEEKKKGVAVKISHKYDNKAEPPTESVSSSSEDEKTTAKKHSYSTDGDVFDSDASSAFSSLSSSSASTDSQAKTKKSSRTKKKKTRKARNSVTAKQERKALERKAIEKRHGRYGHKLMKRWLCSTPSCQNESHHCWQPFEPDEVAGKHFRLVSQDISLWNIALAKRKLGVSVETPPGRLQARLIKRYDRAHAAKKKEVDSEAKKKEPEAHIAAISPPSAGFMATGIYGASPSLMVQSFPSQWQ